MNQNFPSYDVIVIGAGAAGLAAAVTLSEGGASVLVFEKQAEPGGTSVNFRGTFAVESVMQRRKFIAYSRDQACPGRSFLRGQGTNRLSGHNGRY